MRAQRSAHVVTLALKERSAIMLAGHGGDAVTWLSDTLDGWETSSAFSASAGAGRQGVPRRATRSHADFGKTWDALLPAARYRGPDDGAGRSAAAGMDARRFRMS